MRLRSFDEGALQIVFNDYDYDYEHYSKKKNVAYSFTLIFLQNPVKNAK